MISSKYIAASSDTVEVARAFYGDRDFWLETVEDASAMRKGETVQRFVWRYAHSAARWWMNGQAQIDLKFHLTAMNPQEEGPAPPF
jgi:hypothetical protein